MKTFWDFVSSNAPLLLISLELGCSIMALGYTCWRTRQWRSTTKSMILDPLIPRITTSPSCVLMWEL
ncbi:unnamed protein product, partial [Vitis vinifera]